MQGFVQEMSGKRRLQDRLHAIWFVLSSVHDCDSDGHVLKVLRPDGQPSTRTGSEIFQCHLS